MAVNKADTAAINTYGSKNYETPKSVFAMVAYHLAQRIAGTEDRDAIMKVITDEWDALHANGIVPQKPRHFQTVAEEIAYHEGLAAQHPHAAAYNNAMADRLRAGSSSHPRSGREPTR